MTVQASFFTNNTAQDVGDVIAVINEKNITIVIVNDCLIDANSVSQSNPSSFAVISSKLTVINSTIKDSPGIIFYISQGAEVTSMYNLYADINSEVAGCVATLEQNSYFQMMNDDGINLQHRDRRSHKC